MSTTHGAHASAPRRLVRHEPGMFSPTVSTIGLADGTRPYVDVVRLNPGLAAYALEHPGVAPDGPCRYRVDDAPVDPRVRRVLLASHPHVALDVLSARLRAAGHELGVADLRAHEAIAATQAAVWALAAGVALDVADRGVPLAGGARAAHDEARGRAVVTLELAAPTVLRAYELRLHAGGAAVRVHLEASADGVAWRVVAGSHTRPADGAVTHRLAPLATVASSRYPSGERGYRHYRVVAATSDGRAARVEADAVRLVPARGHRFANPTPVVELYRYLLALARDAADTAGAGLVVDGPTLVDTPPAGGLVGPFAVDGPRARAGVPVAVQVHGAGRVVDVDGRPVATVGAGERFWVRLPAGPDGRFAVEAVAAPADDVDVRRLVADTRADGTPRSSTLVAVVPARVVTRARLDVDHLTLATAVRAPR